MSAATSSPERQRDDVLAAVESVDGPVMAWADDWEVSGATDPMTRPKLGPWLRDERGPYDGIAGAVVDRLGRNLVDCLNTGYMMRDTGKLLLTYGHDGLIAYLAHDPDALDEFSPVPRPRSDRRPPWTPRGASVDDRLEDEAVLTPRAARGPSRRQPARPAAGRIRAVTSSGRNSRMLFMPRPRPVRPCAQGRPPAHAPDRVPVQDPPRSLTSMLLPRTRQVERVFVTMARSWPTLQGSRPREAAGPPEGPPLLRG
ncbi:recombinase family protein [Streptomyces sp. NPDC002490]|uniref:recombinase family protein n=1 Tax=Streptomyces sp. NPDC002490 TaxID=3154416 RepID=UPI0033329DD6